jgi:TRAP-type mannitol/chloroaromatic compound transport system substrate-binding protein
LREGPRVHLAAVHDPEGIIKILKFNDALLKTFRVISTDVVAEIGASNELAKKIYASYQQFRASISKWSEIAEHAVINSRTVV